MCGIAQVWLEKPIGFRYIKSMLFFLTPTKMLQNRRPNIARSRSTPRLSTSGGSKPRIDNTFQCDHQVPPSRALLRHCYSYVKELGQLRNYTQFEANNQKRFVP